ncbi:hypothetical protein FHX81_5676 [Saccharothrix saharensis]|uniref:Uncharacterized protein n=1 Tax=Saccharothrix saharensis TaxID=571190 RepID=A0A543JKI7_9PSEU|nr:hypothetical protein [Saccharothrix saharensis]TQM83258.1 hypothetical protein FHX81_5676 [Saccharothrix saharensis]
MSGATRSDRSRGAGRTRSRRRDPQAVGDLTSEITKHLVGLPLDYGGTVDRISALLDAEPRTAEHLAAVVGVIVQDAMGDPFRETNANRWREHLPSWLRPPMVGATVRRLLSAGLLVGTGRYVRSTDARGGNGNKMMPVYSLNLTVLIEHQATVPDQAATA